MTETARDIAARLMKEIGDGKKATYQRGEVKTILNSIAQAKSVVSQGVSSVSSEGCRAPSSVDELRRGDVFIAHGVGGKVRPWIALRISGDTVTAVSLSSGDKAPNMTPAECRFWPGGWIGSTVSQFPMDIAQREVTRPYTNLQHLRDVEREIYQRMGAQIIESRTIAEVRAKTTA